MKTAFRVWLSENPDGSPDGSGWLREPPFAFRPRLPMAPGWIRDGSVRFPWSLSTTIKSHFALRPRLPPAPGWLWDDSVRFALSLSTTLKSHFAFAHSFHLFRGGSVMAPRVSPRARQWHPQHMLRFAHGFRSLRGGSGMAPCVSHGACQGRSSHTSRFVHSFRLLRDGSGMAPCASAGARQWRSQRMLRSTRSGWLRSGCACSACAQCLSAALPSRSGLSMALPTLAWCREAQGLRGSAANVAR